MALPKELGHYFHQACWYHAYGWHGTANLFFNDTWSWVVVEVRFYYLQKTCSLECRRRKSPKLTINEPKSPRVEFPEVHIIMSYQGGLVLTLASFLWRRVVNQLYGYFYYYFPLLPVVGLSRQLSSSYVFIIPHFKQFSPLSCGVPRFLELSCFFVSDLFGNISYFILTTMSSPFHAAFNCSANYTSLVRTSSLIIGISFSFSPLS